jgi:hypothetical protein
MNKRERGFETNSMASSKLKCDEGFYISLYLHDIVYADEKIFAKKRAEYLVAIKKIRQNKRDYSNQIS